MCLLFSACNQPASRQNNKKSIHIDTSKSFRIDTYWATPKKSFDFNSLEKSSDDTLALVTCAEYVYSPFGVINNKHALKNSLLKNLAIVSRTDTMDVGPEEFQILKLKSSKLIFFFDNDTEASKHSSISKGEINDSEVKFDKGIRVGMKIGKFYETFFDYFPEELKTKYQVIVLISCVDDIKHIYTFKNGILNSVIFQNDTYWKVNY
jgi:hypothetical protein